MLTSQLRPRGPDLETAALYCRGTGEEHDQDQTRPPTRRAENICLMIQQIVPSVKPAAVAFAAA